MATAIKPKLDKKSVYVNTNTSWTDDEDQWLINYLKDKRNPNGTYSKEVWIAATFHLKRTAQAIYSRWQLIKFNATEIKVSEPSVDIQLIPADVPPVQIHPVQILEDPYEDWSHRQFKKYITEQDELLECLTKENDGLKELNQSQSICIAGLESQLQEHIFLVPQLQESITQLEQDLMKKQTDFDRLKESHASMVKQLLEVEGANKKLEGQHEKLLKTYHQLQDQFKGLYEEYGDLTKAIISAVDFQKTKFRNFLKVL